MWSFAGGSVENNPACNAGDLDSIPGSGRSPGGGHGHPLLYSCLGKSRGQRNLVGYSSWVHKESDMTEVTQHAHRCMYAFMYAYSFIHFFCSYVLHLEAGMSLISHSSLSLAVRSYLLDFSLGFLKEPRRSNYLTGGPLQ